jgi:hypothetical protein
MELNHFIRSSTLLIIKRISLLVDKVALGQVFPPSSSVFPCQFHSTGAPLLGQGQKIIIIVIFIVGLHNKPHGCGASVAFAAGPFTATA